MNKTSSLLTLDRLRLAVSRVETAKKRNLGGDDTVDPAPYEEAGRHEADDLR